MSADVQPQRPASSSSTSISDYRGKKGQQKLHFSSNESGDSRRTDTPSSCNRDNEMAATPSQQYIRSLSNRTSFVRTCPKAKRVRFLRNGDMYFKGLCYAVSPDRFRSWEALLEDLTRSIGDLVNLPHGVRYIFTTDGKIVNNLDEFEDGMSYVASSTDAFKPIDYDNVKQPTWNFANVRSPPLTETAALSLFAKNENDWSREENADFVQPRIIIVIRNGVKPRKVIRHLLNKKTAPCFAQVIYDITRDIHLDSGIVRKIYTLNGKPVTQLSDFFGDEHVFIAYGTERTSVDDFYLDDQEHMKLAGASKLAYHKSPAFKKKLHWDGEINGSPMNHRRRFLIERNAPIKQSHLPVPPPKPKTAIVATQSDDRALTPTPPDPHPTHLRQPAHSQAASSTTSTSIDEPHHANHNELGEHDGHSPNFVPGGAASEEETPIPQEVSEVLDVDRRIGDGNFAVVYFAHDRRSRQLRALKVISRSRCEGKEDLVQNEISLLQHVQHEHIVRLFDVWNIDGAYYLSLEFVPDGDLFDALVDVRCFNERQSAAFMHDLCSALEYLHSLRIVHRDVKPENLLLYSIGQTRHMKLADFGLACECEHEHALRTVCGTPTYVAPEILMDEDGYGTPVDIWAAGVICYIMLCGFPPFISSDNKQEELFALILQGSFVFPSPYWDHISVAARNLIEEMLHVEPAKRLTATQSLAHKWITTQMRRGINDDDAMWPTLHADDLVSPTASEEHQPKPIPRTSTNSSVYSGWRRSMEELSINEVSAGQDQVDHSRLSVGTDRSTNSFSYVPVSNNER